MWAWASYDFANSAFATSVLTVVFSVYFARVVVAEPGVRLFGMTVPGESLWAYLVSATMAATLIVAPAWGARADRMGTKRRALALCALAGASATMLLFFATPGRVAYAAALAFLAIFAYEMALVFYNAFLNDIGPEGMRGRLSGIGFALGYVGGGLCLALNLAMLSHPAAFGLATVDGTLPARASVLIAGAWWLVFSLPAFLLLRDRPPVARAAGPNPGTFQGLADAIREARRRPDLGRFLLAYLIYDDGVQTVLLMASIFGAKALGMSAAQIAACYLMIQFVAFIGALLAGRFADAVGHKKVVAATLAVFLAAVVWGAFIRTPGEFWVLGVVVGLVMGGVQAASRSLYSLLIPAEKAGELFALFSVVGKAASLAGPFVFGLAAQFLGLRPAVAVIGVFFVAGGALLFSVDERRGREAARLP